MDLNFLHPVCGAHGSILVVLRANRVLLQAIERQRRGDGDTRAFHQLRFGIDRVEAGHVAEPSHHVEVEVTARRVVSKRGVFTEEVGLGDPDLPATPST